jgi:hypothetical protein
MPIIIEKSSYDYRFKREGKRVLVLRDGVCVADWPYEFVKHAVLPTLREQMLRCEELDKAEDIARDSAILLRAGAPFALSDRQDIKDEAVKLACHDRQLRQMPYIRSQEKFGHPTFEVKPPNPTTTEIKP